LFNPIRVKQPKDLPAPFDSWDHIACPEPVISYDKKFNFCSPWVFNMNLISVNEKLVIVEETQSELRKLLQHHGIESLGMPGRHMANLGGGPHCTSLDLIRD
jgi:arginine deiminase